MMLFIRYQTKHKRQFVILYTLVVLLIFGAGYLAIKESNIPPLSIKEKADVAIGVILVIGVVVLAFFSVVKIFWKFKSLGFLTAFGILSLLKAVIDILIRTLFLVSIPLLILDLIVRPYFYYLNMTVYFEDYKMLRLSNEKN